MAPGKEVGFVASSALGAIAVWLQGCATVPGPTSQPTPAPASTPTPEPSPASGTTCGAVWTQCGGKDWAGPTCCDQGLVCKVDNEWYHQCEPSSQPSPAPSPTSPPTPESTPKPTPPSGTTCGAVWTQCGGKDWAGPICCEQGLVCKVDNEWYHQCEPSSQPSPTPSPTAATTTTTTTSVTRHIRTTTTTTTTWQQSTPAPTASPPTPTSAPTPAPTASPPSPTPAPTLGNWDGENMKMTHYWDCSGQGCDATVLQPWDVSKYVSPPGYGPQDPNDHGGAVYGEKMWLTGAASDTLSALMGPDDGCCGGMDDGSGGCGKCVLVENRDSLHPDWTAVVMKKNRCPPEAEGCGANEPHFDVAAPGFDNLQWSLANICGQPDTGFDNQAQSEAVGSWWTQCSNTADCSNLCDELPEHFRTGCSPSIS
eukprot:TRINITY_DN15348_c0_g1_i11.p1 TRINITY_DN15348_c0_g1~~TRINITY_DN15348_c0_g1_i11.p1  ORF type:complete len:424 (+),score=33.12 TRINITY_DN15348_c0_g1_i11:112-1383(+)